MVKVLVERHKPYHSADISVEQRALARTEGPRGQRAVRHHCVARPGRRLPGRLGRGAVRQDPTPHLAVHCTATLPLVPWRVCVVNLICAHLRARVRLFVALAALVHSRSGNMHPM